MLKHLKTAVATAFAIVLTAIMASCSNEEDVKNPAATTGAASAMESTLQDSYSAILNADLSLDPDAPASRTTKAAIDPSMRAANVYVKMPAYYDHADVAMVQQAHSVNDLLAVTREVGAQLSFEKTVDTDIVITLSEDKAKQTLMPLISECKKYLYSKGFSEKDIQEMIASENASEADLIALVITCSELEETRDKYMADKNFTDYIFMNEPTHQDTMMSWSKVGGCLLHAIGVNAVKEAILLFGAHEVSKKVAIQIFKVVVKKYAGWVGAALIAVDFIDCLAS